MTGARVGVAVCALLLVVGCGGGGSGTATAPRSDLGTTLERALREVRPSVGVTDARCHPASPRERKQSRVRGARSSLYVCAIRAPRASGEYFVQVLRNGCFIAEREKPPHAIYGCDRRLAAR